MPCRVLTAPGKPERGRWAPGHLAPKSNTRRWAPTDEPEDWRGVGEERRRLFVGGLPRPVTQANSEQLIYDMFAPYRPITVSKVISPNTNGRWKVRRENDYFAFVEFRTAEEAKQAMRATNGTVIKGTELTVDLSRSGPRDTADRVAKQGYEYR